MRSAAISSAALAGLCFLSPTALAAVEPAKLPPVEEQVRLVLIDAVVTDADGNPVPGLTLSDFTLKVDGKRAAIDAVEDRCTGSPAESAAPGGAGATPEAPASAPPPPAPAGKLAPKVVLYFDLPHLSPPGAFRSVSAAKRFIASPEAAGVRYMVIAYGPKVRILAPFTDDKDRILAALDQVMGPGVTYDEGPLAHESNLQSVVQETCPETLIPIVAQRMKSCPNQVAMARQYAQIAERSARASLAALSGTMIGLSGASDERKALVFFSETLEREPGVEYLEIAKTTPRGEQISIDLDWARLVSEANSARVSFYPVFPPGLGEHSDTAIAYSSTSLPPISELPRAVQQMQEATNPGKSTVSGGLRRGNTENLAQVTEALRHAESAAIDFNASVAVATGGRHLGRTNALDLVFNLVAEDRACTYVLAHKPEAEEPGKEHRIAVDVDRKHARVRSRESFVDWRPGEQAERRMRMAMAAPGSFNAFALDLAAFPLGEAGGRTKVLVSVSIPARDLARSAEGLAAHGTIASVRLRGRVATEDESVCQFGEPFDLPADLYEGGPASVHFEAACDLRPGRYELVAAVEEELGGELGAVRREIYVPDLSSLYIGDAQLWVAAQDDLVHRKEAEAILGASKGLERGAAAPRAERRLASGESGGLFTLVCPGRAGSDLLPITLTRMLLVDEKPVATFPPLQLAELPGDASGCWGVTSPLPQGVLGPGIYSFDYKISSHALPEPAGGRADFAVGDPLP